MAENEELGGVRPVRTVGDITPGFQEAHQDDELDLCLDEFFRSGSFPSPASLATALPNDVGALRIKKLLRLEDETLPPHRRYCTELRDGIRAHFSGEAQVLLLESMKFMLRVHIDDKDRTDTGLPGVSHQIRVALDVLRTLVERDPEHRHNANILAAAMFHDIVEDHERILLLEKEKIQALRARLKPDGSLVIPADMSSTNIVITLLEAEGGFIGRPNRVLGDIMRKLTLNRSALLQEWEGLPREEARRIAAELKSKHTDPAVEATRAAKKDDLYRLYTMDTLTDPTLLGEAALLIKIFDLRDNALSIGAIRQKAESLRDVGSPDALAEAERLRIVYNRFQEKYRPVLRDAHDILSTWPLQSLVGSVAQSMSAEIERVLRKEYETALSAFQ